MCFFLIFGKFECYSTLNIHSLPSIFGRTNIIVRHYEEASLVSFLAINFNSQIPGDNHFFPTLIYHHRVQQTNSPSKEVDEVEGRVTIMKSITHHRSQKKKKEEVDQVPFLYELKIVQVKLEDNINTYDGISGSF